MNAHKLTIFYDSMCPICATEISLLRKKDRASKLSFIDITTPDYDPTQYGLTMEDVVGSIHGISQSGDVISGMELFRQVYHALGVGWVWGWTAWPGFRQLADAGYGFFARIRPRFSSFDYRCNQSCGVDRDQASQNS